VSLLLTIPLLHLLACLSPGPDVLLVIRNSARAGARAGFATTLGIMLGVGMQIAAAMAGLAAALAARPELLRYITLAGASYLVWIGASSLRPRRQARQTDNAPAAAITPGKAWRQGLLTNLLNPKAMLYFLSLFSAVLHAGLPIWLKLLCALEMIAVQTAAFLALSHLTSRAGFGAGWRRLGRALDPLCSLALVAFGGWLLLSVLSG
jgi:threonine/homoserine/homoserine lactone efflux protein